MKNKKGFTLIEVIVTLVIVGVLIAIAVPSVMKYINDAEDARILGYARTNLQETQKYFVEEMGKYSGEQKDLQSYVSTFTTTIENDAIKQFGNINTPSFGDYTLRQVVVYYDGMEDINKYSQINPKIKNHQISKIGMIYKLNNKETIIVSIRVNEGSKVFHDFNAMIKDPKYALTFN